MNSRQYHKPKQDDNEELSFQKNDIDLLRQQSLLLVTNLQERDESYITSDFNDIETIYQCSKFSNTLLEKNSQVLINIRSTSEGHFSLELNDVAHHLIEQINAINRIGKLSFKTYNPYFTLFFSHFYMTPFLKVKPGKHLYSSFDVEVIKGIAQTLDDFLVTGTSKGFKARLHNYHKTYKDNRKSLREYVDALFENNIRLLVIRLDLSYPKIEVCRQRNTLSSRQDEGFSVSEIIDHRRQFIKMVKDKFDTQLKGYCWKLEHGREKGYHYHVVLFLDANKLCRDVAIAAMLGEMWKKDITNGNGLYYNCNANSKKYRSSAVGMIHLNDESAQIGMNHIIDYLTKMDLYVRAFLPDGSRTMGKGIMPKRVTVGRPRASEQAAALPE